MVNTKIAHTLRKNHKRSNSKAYKIHKKWLEAENKVSDFSNNIIAGVTKKTAKITTLPINGHLSIDNEPLKIDQIILLNDVSRLKFTIKDGIQNSNYGDFKFIVFKGSVTEEEFYFKLDANIINNSLYTNDNHENISLSPANNLSENTDAQTNSGFKLKNEKLEKELLDFIAKRESGVVFDTKADSWVEATKSIFEEDIFDTDKVKSEAR